MTKNTFSPVEIKEGMNHFKTTPTKVLFGVDCIKKIGDLIREFDPRKILIVSGQKTIERHNFKSYLEDYKFAVYRVKPRVTVQAVESGLNFFKKNNADLIIGFGGGSAIDTGKAIAILSKNTGSVRDYLFKKEAIKNNGLPFIAIPTTSGTGSEVTRYASIIDEKNKEKKSLSHEFLCPDATLVDPKFILTLPPRITAITGMDALSQGMEAYWSVNASLESDVYALSCIKLAFENLEKAYHNPENIKFRERMSKASLLSGVAITHTRTTIVHSVSYPITTYFNVPHGLACSLTLPYFMEFNSEAAPEKILKISQIMGAKNVSEGTMKLKHLIAAIGLETRLSELGVKKEDVEIIIKKGFRPDRAERNPRKVTEVDLREILMKIL